MDYKKARHTLRVVSATCKLLLGSSSYSFKDKVVLITGGSRGLGLVLSRQLVDQGARLCLCARDAAELQRAADELRARGSEILTYTGDVSVHAQARDAVEATVARFGRLDVLINDAGIIQVGPLQHMKLEDFRSALGVHFWGPLYTMLAAIPHLRRAGGGRILNIASIGGKIPIPQLAPYCASKFALVGLSSGLRNELLRDNIFITTACPWLMRTGSHYNAQFKGQNKKTFTEFAIADGLPLLTVNAERAAQQILRACQRGRAELIVGFQARLLYSLSSLMPETFSIALSLMNQLMPGPIGPEGNVSHPGWESETPWAPSLLTRLADQAAARNNELKDHPKPA